ncbi:MAG TPA: glycosyltransferase family 39 protein [Bradyrhizobium sp.]|nr:glycosyltransferase family 39 protein [Bradyrhizobium sp.]
MDGVEEGWAIPLLLLGFVAIWQVYFAIAYADGDLHPDVLETWTLGRSLAWGYSKHPPLMGWMARAWTTFFPLTNWSFDLLSLTNSAFALWITDLITRRFVRGDKRLIALLLLMLLPIYQFHAQRFNANAVLLATWPLATYCFLRSFETGSLDWAIAAGASAALAMLGKYFSVFLIASFLVAAICHPQRRAYFGSLAPWVSSLVGLLMLAPHIHWLATTGAKPFAYALTKHAGKELGPSLGEAIGFLLCAGLVVLLPAATWVLMAGDRMKRFCDDFHAMNPGLLLLFMISLGTLFFPAITSAVMGTDMPPVWSLQGLFLFVILIVCGASYQIDRVPAVNLAAGVIAISIGAALVVAPVHAYYRNFHPLSEGRNFYQASADELTRRWHAITDLPLPSIGGDEDLAFSTAFYSPDHPFYEERLLVGNGWRFGEVIRHENGWAGLCFGDDESCIGTMERIAARAPRVIRSDFELQSSLLGQPGAIERFTAVIVPPASDAPPSVLASGPGVVIATTP